MTIDLRQNLAIIKGKDHTDDILRIAQEAERTVVTYKSGKSYRYARYNVECLSNLERIPVDNYRPFIAGTDRINIEFSHLAGFFERSVSPMDVPEMKTTANFILCKIRGKDPDQYSALLQRIGVTEDPAEEPQTAVEAQ